jgi:Phosphotransferase enzyme family
VLTPPDGLAEADLVAVLRRRWRMTLTSLRYLAVGWGSHHWEATDGAGSRWFVTVDDLEAKRLSDCEPLPAAFARLRASLAAAVDLRHCGAAFVLAPVPADNGEPLAPVDGRFTVAVYPFLSGQTFEWGDYSSPEIRRGLLGLVVGVHTAPAAARRHALRDEFAVPFRRELEAACAPATPAADCGPYARAASALVQQNAAAIRHQLARYDGLVASARSLPPERAVLTHGEPHPGNTMLAAGGLAGSPGDSRPDGWVLIDWDTALVAPPERDLWPLDPGDGSILAAYTSATGLTPEPGLLELYRLRWDITDLALDSRRLRRPHADTADTRKTWGVLQSLAERIAGASA